MKIHSLKRDRNYFDFYVLEKVFLFEMTLKMILLSYFTPSGKLNKIVLKNKSQTFLIFISQHPFDKKTA